MRTRGGVTTVGVEGAFGHNVFINCPFDKEYRPLLEALLFTVIECGLEPRIASETSDSGEVRIEKVKRLVRASRYSVHDISRIETQGSLPRFNMPFELGLDLGCREYGDRGCRSKKALILEQKQYRYQQVLSDIAGQDIKAHDGESRRLVKCVRDWVVETVSTSGVPSASRIWQRLTDFHGALAPALAEQGYTQNEFEEMPVPEFIRFIKEWRSVNAG